MSHTFAHKNMQKKFPRSMKYMKKGELDLSMLPPGMMKEGEDRGISMSDLENRLKQHELEQKLKDKTF